MYDKTKNYCKKDGQHVFNFLWYNPDGIEVGLSFSIPTTHKYKDIIDAAIDIADTAKEQYELENEVVLSDVCVQV